MTTVQGPIPIQVGTNYKEIISFYTNIIRKCRTINISLPVSEGESERKSSSSISEVECVVCPASLNVHQVVSTPAQQVSHSLYLGEVLLANLHRVSVNPRRFDIVHEGHEQHQTKHWVQSLDHFSYGWLEWRGLDFKACFFKSIGFLSNFDFNDMKWQN